MENQMTTEEFEETFFKEKDAILEERAVYKKNGICIDVWGSQFNRKKL